MSIDDQFSEAMLRARAVGGHYATGAYPNTPQNCQRCGKSVNRWNEPCDATSTESLVAQDFLALADLARRYESALREIASVLPSSDCPENGCEGCKAEMGMALDAAQKALA